MAKAVFPVITNCPEGREAEFNHWYNTMHVPDILQLPGFVACTRYQMVGSPRERQGKFLALYEMEADDPAAAVDALWKAVAELQAKGRMFDGTQLVYAAPYQPIADRVTK